MLMIILFAANVGLAALNFSTGTETSNFVVASLNLFAAAFILPVVLK